ARHGSIPQFAGLQRRRDRAEPDRGDAGPAPAAGTGRGRARSPVRRLRRGPRRRDAAQAVEGGPGGRRRGRARPTRDNLPMTEPSNHASDRPAVNLSRFQSLIALAVMVVALGLGTERFRTVDNGLNVLRQISINLCLSLGMTLVILSGGID